MGAVAGLPEQKLGAPGDDHLAEVDKVLQDGLKVHLLRLAAGQRQGVDAKRCLQAGKAVQLVEHHVFHRVALQFDNNTDPVAVRLIAQIRDSLDPFVADAFGDFLDQF